MPVEDTLTRLINLFEESEMNMRDSRELAIRDRDYYDGRQWTSEEQQSLRKRGQPCITMNRIKPNIDTLLGLEQAQRNDPKAVPRTPLHDADAAAVTDILRYIETRSEFDDIRSHSFKNFIIEGTAACKVEVRAIESAEGNIKDFDIKIKPVEWDRVFWDPHARLNNFKDARYKGEVAFLDIDAAKDLFPGKEDIIDGATNQLGRHHDGLTDTFSDQPTVIWTDKERKRVRIVEIWYKKGQEIYYAIFTKGGFLVEPTRTPFRDDMGFDEDPYILRSAYVARDGARYGHVRQMIDPQDEVNKRRSKALHLVNVRQTRVSRSTELDTGKLRKELARPDGIVRAEPDEFELIPTSDMAQAQFNLLADAQNQLAAVGVNPAISGKTPGQVSGKALQARSVSGSVELGPLFDGIRMWQREVFKKAWNRVREYWTEEKYIAVTDDPTTTRFILLNREESQFSLNLDQTQNVTSVQTPIPELDVDIIVREGPNDVLAQQEQFIELSRMAASGVQIPMQLLIELSSLRPQMKDKILKAMQPDPAQVQRQQQIQEQQIALEFAAKEAEILNDRANATKKLADADKLSAQGRSQEIDNLKETLKPLD